MIWTSYEAFAGIGAWGKALERVSDRHGDSHKLLGYWEFDKYASNAFAAIHNVSEDLNHWDITEDKHDLESADIFFYSPPCQTFSLAGKREGREVDKGNLFWNALHKIKVVKPKYAIMENVANLAQQFESDFKDMLTSLDEAGYISYNKVLNSKDYGIPQNRERIFIVSIRKDVYESGVRFEWPEKIDLKLRLKDMLESEVDEKYYLSEKTLSFFMANTEKQQANGNGFRFDPKDGDDIAKAITTRAGARMDDNFIKVNQVGNIVETKSFGGNPQRGRVGKGVAQTLTTSCNQGVIEPNVLTPKRTEHGKQVRKAYEAGEHIESRHTMTKMVPRTDGIRNSLTLVQKDNYVALPGLRIRKLTPLECFRLQGFDDEDYYKAVEAYDQKWKAGASDSQMYKRAGNSITVNVIEEMLEQLLYQRKQDGAQLSFF